MTFPKRVDEPRWLTSDGKEFKSEGAAKEHEAVERLLETLVRGWKSADFPSVTMLDYNRLRHIARQLLKEYALTPRSKQGGLL